MGRDLMGGMPERPTQADARAPLDLRTDRPHAARVYDVLLGGKTNYAADRAMAEQVLVNLPSARSAALANRSFIHRATRYLAAEAGVRQFLDIGTGIPTSPNLHEVAQGVAPDSRVVYVDNDPIVLAHSRALHIGHPSGRTAYMEADAADPEAILASGVLRETLDLGRPVALSMCLLLHWLPADSDPYAVVRRLMEELPPGSHLVITHLARDLDQAGSGGLESDFKASGSQLKARTKDEVARFFDGLTLVTPGLVPPHRWRPGRLVAVGGTAGGQGAAGDAAGLGDTAESGGTADTPESRQSAEEFTAPVWAGVAVKGGC
ncbi:SAM-dependent methyltransferase [Streptomyces sp. NBC_01089]|uniref:SAM-dependent methyltransferase n=1 Tax=Streptomyces sp. NBC_01089 TaxID=2903747 RepID=UPI003866E8AB|nr:SAM-dependent methyltransferase [Streptomyces sp. NBC_01089]